MQFFTSSFYLTSFIIFMPGYFCTVAHEDGAIQIIFWAGKEEGVVVSTGPKTMAFTLKTCTHKSQSHASDMNSIRE